MEHLGTGVSTTDIGRIPYCGAHLGDPDNNVHKFHSFIDNNDSEWDIDDKGRLKWKRLPTGQGILPHQVLRENATKFVQHWLFFALLREVLSDDRTFRYTHFIDERWVTTAPLKGYLERWEQREKDATNSSGRMARMIKAHQALEKARQYVSDYLAVQNENDTPTWVVDERVSLSIIVLGEALTRALSRIQNECGHHIKGWHYDPNTSQGWGYSRLALQRFSDNKWCKKTINMLKVLMKGNTIGLLLAFSYPLRDSYWHKKCTNDECVADSEKVVADVGEAVAFSGPESQMNDEQYNAHLSFMKSATVAFGDSVDPAERREALREIKHNESRLRKAPHYDWLCGNVMEDSDLPPCEYLGPDMTRLIGILHSDQIPLFHYDMITGELSTQGLEEGSGQEYTVFSHVWADAWGNAEKNEIFRCKLHHLAELCRDVSSRPGDAAYNTPQLFWIDALGIPLGNEHIFYRNKAIRKIHEVYRNASHTVVLDTGLMAQQLPAFTGAAIRITMSKWMTRLWTLQEAVLSKNLHFKFADKPYHLKDIDSMLEREDRNFHGCLSATARIYYDSMVGDQLFRLRNVSSGRFETTKVTSPLFVASVWRAVQWRSSAYAQHESLALAILLDIDTDSFAYLVDTNLGRTIGRDELDCKMRDLFHILGREERLRIPAGMIFLGGDKLPMIGFRWAPRTWLSREPVLSPDPLLGGDAESLDSKGLVVKFPGLILHEIAPTENRLVGGSYFHVPIHHDLLDWFRIDIASPDETFPDSRSIRGRRLAVIALNLSVNSQRNIALLVAINDSARRIHYVETLCRVWLTREPRVATIETCRARFQTGGNEFEKALCAEQTPLDQLWCVDGADPDLQPKRIDSDKPESFVSANEILSAPVDGPLTPELESKPQIFPSRTWNNVPGKEVVAEGSKAVARAMTFGLWPRSNAVSADQ